MEIARITSDLFCLSESKPGNGPRHYSYFLKRDGGNLLFHPLKKTSELRKSAELFDGHGGIKLQILTHGAEASSTCEWIHQRYGAGLYFHHADKPHVLRKTKCPIATAFATGHQVDEGLEAVPLSGHTLGFTAYRLISPSGVFLFIGDFLVPKEGVWIANVYKLLMPVGIANLNELKRIGFDYLLPNKSKGPGQPPFKMGPAERESTIDDAISRLAGSTAAKGR